MVLSRLSSFSSCHSLFERVIPRSSIHIPFPGFETSNSQYVLECNRRLNFSLGDSTQCYSYRIIDDLECELHDNMSHFAVRVTLITTDDSELQIESDFSVATVTVDDSTEPECCK